MNNISSLAFQGTVTNSKGKQLRTTTPQQDGKTVDNWQGFLENKANYSRVVCPDRFCTTDTDKETIYSCKRPFGDTLMISKKGDDVEVKVRKGKGLKGNEVLTISNDDIKASETLQQKVSQLLTTLKEKAENAALFNFYDY